MKEFMHKIHLSLYTLQGAVKSLAKIWLPPESLQSMERRFASMLTDDFKQRNLYEP
jgi:hypothetical protein